MKIESLAVVSIMLAIGLTVVSSVVPFVVATFHNATTIVQGV